MSPLAWALALMITAGAASLQGTVGIGFAMVSVPLLSLIHPSLAPVPQLFVALPLAITMAWRERHAIDLSGFWWIIGGRLPGAFLGVVLLAIATQRVLEIAIAVIVLGAVAVIASGVHIRRTPGTRFGVGVGSGLTGLVASIGGPPIALIYSSEETETIRSTVAAVFTIGILTTITVRYATGNISWNDVGVGLALFPAVVVGYLASVLLKDRVSKSQARIAILVVSGLAATVLLARALVA